jgi:hypothetical protein
LEDLQLRLEPLRERLAGHALYGEVRGLDDLRVFMESHVFAVWDFMSLLKSLQRELTCVQVPWAPTPFPASRRFINEIVQGEESDVYDERPLSHFEIYLEAMELAGADTSAIRALASYPPPGLHELRFEGIPDAAREFVEATFRVIREGSPAAQAAAFALGREDAIPAMFRSLVRGLSREADGRLDTFVWYLERHIEVDGDDHGPLALGMVVDLCGEDGKLWDEAAEAAEDALRARIALWDGVLAEIRARR